MFFKSTTIILQLAILGLTFIAMQNAFDARQNSFRLFLTYCAETGNHNLLCQDLVRGR